MKKIEESNLDKKIVQKISGQVNPKKSGNTVIVNGDLYEINYQDKSEIKNATPDCSCTKCNEMQHPIQDVCKKYSWPAGKPVLVCDATTGNCCYCHCR